jgi:hypothetical protein
MSEKRFTIVFEGDISKIDFNPMTAHDTKFGNVVGSSIGDALARTDESEAELDLMAAEIMRLRGVLKQVREDLDLSEYGEGYGYNLPQIAGDIDRALWIGLPLPKPVVIREAALSPSSGNDSVGEKS